MKNKLSEYFSAPFWDSHFYVKKEKLSMNFPKNASKSHKVQLISVWLTFWRKTVFVNIYPLLLVWSKKLFKHIQIFLRICPISNMVRKTNFCVFQCSFFEIVTFLTTKKVLYEFPQNCFKTTERHSLAVCGSLCGEKQFLLIFIPFNWFDQKQLFKQIQIFLRICPISNIVRKTNFLSISVLVSEIVTYMSKKKSSLWISQKCFKTKQRPSLSVWV